jgi:hypothetical protein
MNGLGTAISAKVDMLVQCICAALAVDGAGPTCFCGVVPGDDVAWDYCGECDDSGLCGMGYVRINQSYVSENFPTQIPATNGCRTGVLTLELVVGSLRCVPLPEEDGTLPNEADQAEAWDRQIADMSALFTAICECFPDASIGSYSALGPQGGCAGGEWTVWVSL